MALEQSGISLETAGFKQYLANLDAIEKKQRAVFDTQFSGTDKSFAQVQRAAANYQKQLKSLETEYNKAVASEQKLTAARQQQAGASSALGSAIGAIGLAVFSRQTAEVVIESSKAAAAFQGQSAALNSLAASYGQAGNDIRDAMRRAAQGVLSESSIIRAANQGLLLGVAKTPEEFGRITNAAIVLGRTLGIEANTAIERFTLGLGRQSQLIIDDFGLSVTELNRRIEQLSQTEFGKTNQQLSDAQKQAVFLEAALSLADEKVASIGEGAGQATANFDRLSAQTENLKTAFGAAILPLVSQVAGKLAEAATTAGQIIAFATGGFAALDTIVNRVKEGIDAAQGGATLFERGIALAKGEIGVGQFVLGFDVTKVKDVVSNFGDILDEAGADAIDAFKPVAEALGATFPQDVAKPATESIEENSQAVEKNDELLKSLQNSIKQAEQLELSFSRAAEDAARKLARQQAKLAQDQLKDRLKLLDKQGKDFDKFQGDELKDLQKAEKKLDEARSKAAEDQKKQQDKLFRELRQAREKFDLDQLQSRRRFDLQDRRLRAAGDILALQELREDFSLQQQEAQENFSLQQKQRKEDGKDQQQTADEQRQEKIKQLEQDVNDLQSGLDQRRADFLAAQEEEFNALLIAQQEQRDQLQQSYAEQQEDARINQQRQLEDLGRSLADQRDLTSEGAMAVAGELENIFGQEGVADQIYSGFVTRQESKFRELYDNIGDIIATGQKQIEKQVDSQASQTSKQISKQSQLFLPIIQKQDFGPASDISTSKSRLDNLGIPSFDFGGVVGGTRGAPQLIQAHGGETVLPTHRMNAPIVPSQNLNVNMQGGFDIRGGEIAGQVAVRAAISEMTDALEIAVRRLGRRI